VQFYVDGRLVRRDAARPFTALVPRRLVRRGGSSVQALVTLGDLRRQTVARTLRRC
jgi:hypothetical protein